MEPITTAIAISALWSLLDSTLKIVATEAVKETSKPFNAKISNWFQKFTKLEEKNRYQTFLDAYYNAEQRFIQKHGIGLAYRTFRQIPKAVDSYRKNPRYVIDSLIYKVPTDESETRNEREKVKEFMDFVKRELWGTDLYRPIIEYYNEEEAQDLRKNSAASLSTLAKTVDLSLDAIRVVIAQPPKDFQTEREKYLKRIETTFLEHQLSGLPIYREVKNPLLNNLFVVLDLGFENGGEALNEELEKIFENEEHPVSDLRKSETESSSPWFDSADVSFNNTIFEKNLWLVVLGEPGSGKTTTLKKMSLDYAESAQLGEVSYSGIPIYLPLREYAKERKKSGVGYGLLDFIYDYSKGSLSIPCSSGFFEYYLEKGDNLVCFDGLDEVTSVGQRQEITDVVESFIQLYPKNWIVVTSRVSGYEQAPLTRRLFPHYAVKFLSDQKIRSYIKQWYGLREITPEGAEKQAGELYDAIMKQDRILKLARNPLLLTIISLIHRVEATLPNDRVKLYEKCSEALLNTFEGAKQIENRDEEKEYFRFKEDLLEAVAYWMQQHETKDQGVREIVVDEVELITFLTDFLSSNTDFNLTKREARQQAERFISLVQERTGILVERGKGQYAFVHLTFQEYFAASYVCKTYLHNAEELLSIINPILFEPSWKEVILLLLGKLGHLSKKMPSLLADRILKANLDDILHQALQLLTSALVDNVKFDRTIQDSIFQNWLTILKHPICETEVRVTVSALQSIRVVLNLDDLLIDLAKDSSQNLRFRLLITRIYLDEPTSLEWVFDNLKSLIFNPNVDEFTLASSMDLILNVQFSFDARIKFIKSIQESNLWHKQILALVLNHKIIDDERPFRDEIVPMKEYFSADIVDEVAEFSLIFAHLGDSSMWERFLLNISQPGKNIEILNNILYKTPSLFWKEPFDSTLLRMPYLRFIRVPENLTEAFTKCLLDSLAQPIDIMTKISVITWLGLLRAVDERILNFLLTIEDDYSFDVESFFVDYIKEKCLENENTPFPIRLQNLTEKIFGCHNTYIRMSYFQALKSVLNETPLTNKLIEWISNDNIPIATKYIILIVWGHELWSIDSVMSIVKSWLNQTNGWEQAFIADALIQKKLVEKSNIRIILEQLNKSGDASTVHELIQIIRKHGEDQEAIKIAKSKIESSPTLSIDDRMIRGFSYHALRQPVKKYSANEEVVN